MNGVEVLRAGDAAQARAWDEAVDHSPSPDAYFRAGYAAAYEVAGQGSALAVVVPAGSVRVLFPFLLAPLKELRFAHSVAGCDAVTPYGYGGVLALKPGEPDWAQAIQHLRAWCAANQVVACLFRLHPLRADSASFRIAAPALGMESVFRGHTTALDLTNWDATHDCPAGLAKGRLSDLSKARRSLRFEWGATRRHLTGFRELYEKTMDRLGAGGFYRYPLAYYEKLADGLGERFSVATAWAGDELAGAALFLCESECIHYHLSAASERGRELRATTLLIQAGAARGRERGCRHLHLGGGARPDDSLWAFKRSFGGRKLDYHFATLVADQAAYQQLVSARTEAPGLAPPNRNFLVYRT